MENSSGKATAYVVVKVYDTPSAPISFKVKSVTCSAVALTWKEPLNNGNSEITHYKIEKKEITKKAWTTVDEFSKDTSYKVQNLQEGSSYLFR